MAKKEERKIVSEREYIIPLRREMEKAPSYRRAKKAVLTIRKFLLRHMKIYDRDESKIKISKWVNQEIWRNSAKNPPHKIKVKAVKYSTGEVEAELVELSKKESIAREKEAKLKVEASKVQEQREAEQKKQEEMEKAHAEEHAKKEQETQSEQKKQEEKKEEKAEEEKEKIEEEKKEIMQKEVHTKEKHVAEPKQEVHKRTMTGV